MVRGTEVVTFGVSVYVAESVIIASFQVQASKVLDVPLYAGSNSYSIVEFILNRHSLLCHDSVYSARL